MRVAKTPAVVRVAPSHYGAVVRSLPLGAIVTLDDTTPALDDWMPLAGGGWLRRDRLESVDFVDEEQPHDGGTESHADARAADELHSAVDAHPR